MEALASQVFVGRAGELGQLERVLGEARAGTGTTALVSGDAGIGKTRLASLFAARAREQGFEVLLGRSIDLVGTELPYQPFVEALRPFAERPRTEGPEAGSQLRVFDETLALLSERAAAAPVLLILEDLHWADASTLDLVVFLAHNLGDRPVLLLVTYRADELSSAARLRRFAAGVRRSGSALMLELGPLEPEELAALLAARATAVLPAAMTEAIVARSEGNPFFAEELLSAAGDQNDALPHGLRDLLLQRVAQLTPHTQTLLRVAAAAGRDVGYPLLSALAESADPVHLNALDGGRQLRRREQEVHDSLRQAVEHAVLVADQASGTFRFRHALLAEAIYATILPGEREELHAKLAEELARSGAATAAELAPHWEAAGRSAETLSTSVDAARQAEAVFGLAEAHAHLERALAQWHNVPAPAELAGLSLVELCAWTAELASEVGAAPRAVELAQRAIELIGTEDPHRASLLQVRLGEYLHETGNDHAGLAALERAVELVPPEPPSAEGAYALGSLAGGLMVAWRHAESLPIGEQALALARAAGGGDAEVRALTVVGNDLAYLGRGQEGLAHLRQALQMAEEIGDRIGLDRAYVNLTDALTMMGRPQESARLGYAGLKLMRRYGIDSAVLVANSVEALLAIGEWDKADSLSAAELRATTGSFHYMLLMVRADLEVGRGDFEAARSHLETALATLREDRGQGVYDIYLAELALWQRRWIEADQAVRDGLAAASSGEAAQLRVWFCAKGLRAQAELTALARARHDTDAYEAWFAQASKLVAIARRSAAKAVTPNAAGWLSLAEAEYLRAREIAQPGPWSTAADAWDQLERPPLAAYCRWREAEALVAACASRREASVPLRSAYDFAARTGAKPLLHELELLAERARLDLAPPAAEPSSRMQRSEETLGLSPREAEVLALVARGYTNREIAAELVISVRTAGVHVSHILRRLGVPNRTEAAAVAHRISPPRARPPASTR